ncbi:Protein C35D10.6 [Aphelenchoides avenae]|nr:Protein C35D10.6 [Aphelenchus avenae]
MLDKTGREYVRNKMPSIGLGTYQVTSKTDIYAIVDAALDAGYRFIDTAQVYKNEGYIGRALKELLPKYGLTREDIFITTKLSPANQGSSKVEPSLIRSLESLQTDYVDLFLIHWPGTSHADIRSPLNKTRRMESWAEMERLHKNGKCRAIGVSNYEIRHLEELLQQTTVLPAVNQCEYHPHYYQMDLVEFCGRNDIHFQVFRATM